LSSTCFEQLSVHHQEDLYMQLYGILSCNYVSSLVAVRMHLIPPRPQYEIHPDSKQTAYIVAW